MLSHSGDPGADADGSSGSDAEEEEGNDGDEVVHMEVDLEDDEGAALLQNLHWELPMLQSCLRAEGCWKPQHS